MCSSVWMFIMKKIKKTKKAKATVIKDHTRSAFVHKRFTLADIKRLLASLFWACNSWKDIFISLCSSLKHPDAVESLHSKWQGQNILDLNQGVVILWHYYPLRQQRRFSCFHCHFFTLLALTGLLLPRLGFGYWDVGACSVMNASLHQLRFLTSPVCSRSARHLKDAPHQRPHTARGKWRNYGALWRLNELSGCQTQRDN